MRSTLKDIVQSLDISKSAIFRYLNNDPKLRLSPETKKRFDATVKKMNYRPSQAACSFRNGRTNMVGMTPSGITDNFSSHLAEACIYFCEKKNYQLLLTLSSLNIEKEHHIILNLLDRRVYGIIVARAIPEPGSQIDKTSV
jgi:DNA-binding LacI/PurR family transcriptional regulator